MFPKHNHEHIWQLKYHFEVRLENFKINRSHGSIHGHRHKLLKFSISPIKLSHDEKLIADLNGKKCQVRNINSLQRKIIK